MCVIMPVGLTYPWSITHLCWCPSVPTHCPLLVQPWLARVPAAQHTTQGMSDLDQGGCIWPAQLPGHWGGFFVLPFASSLSLHSGHGGASPTPQTWGALAISWGAIP